MTEYSDSLVWPPHSTGHGPQATSLFPKRVPKPVLHNPLQFRVREPEFPLPPARIPASAWCETWPGRRWPARSARRRRKSAVPGARSNSAPRASPRCSKCRPQAGCRARAGARAASDRRPRGCRGRSVGPPAAPRPIPIPARRSRPRGRSGAARRPARTGTRRRTTQPAPRPRPRRSRKRSCRCSPARPRAAPQPRRAPLPTAAWRPESTAPRPAPPPLPPASAS